MSRATARRPARVLVVDDDPGLLRLLTIRLRSEKYEVEPAESAAKALASIARFRPDLVVTDLRMAQMDGLALLHELKRRWPSLNVIVLTAHGTIPDAVRATQSGAFAFLTKPVEKEQLLDHVRRALRTSGFNDAQDDWQSEFVTRSPVFENLLAQARLVAANDSGVYISGEPGTGREPLARAIHRASAHGDRTLLEIDCADLVAEEGAQRLQRTLQQAVGSSVLLGNVEDLAPALHGPATRGIRSLRPRVLITSELPPDQWLAQHRSAEELLDVVGGVHFAMPALARRREDIPLLVAQALEELQSESPSAPARTCAPDAIELLAAAQWPGNVRQLRSVVREAAMLAPGPVITAELVQQCLGTTAQVPSFDEARDEFTRAYLVQLLKVANGNVSQAARLARRNRTDFYKLLTRYRIAPEDFKAQPQ